MPNYLWYWSEAEDYGYIILSTDTPLAPNKPYVYYSERAAISIISDEEAEMLLKLVPKVVQDGRQKTYSDMDN